MKNQRVTLFVSAFRVFEVILTENINTHRVVVKFVLGVLILETKTLPSDACLEMGQVVNDEPTSTFRIITVY